MYFVNYDYIKKQIVENIKKLLGQTQGTAPTELCRGEPCVHPENDYELKLKTDFSYKNKIWFYSSDYQIFYEWTIFQDLCENL